jgi:hypothetical protein
MSRMFAALMLLSLALPSRTVAGPPEGVSGKMTFDNVADGLRKYHKEKDDGKRLAWLRRLGPTRDLRVAVALGDAFEEGPLDFTKTAAVQLFRHYLPAPVETEFLDQINAAYFWWQEHKADLRRRAKQLPR